MIEWPSAETVKTYAEIFTSALIPVSIYLAYLQIRKTLEWNKKTAAEQAISQVTKGETLKLYEKLAYEFGWNLLTDKRGYNDIARDLSGEDLSKVDNMLLMILRELETLAIKIDHEVYDESICFDHLFSIVINTHKRCSGYIEKARAERAEKRLFEHIEKYAKQWDRDLSRGRRH